eukprot:2890752-Heterocapsa_arctica.AAC.1
MFPERLLAANYRQTRLSRLYSCRTKTAEGCLAEEASSRIAWNYKLGYRGRTISWDRVVIRREE